MDAPEARPTSMREFRAAHHPAAAAGSGLMWLLFSFDGRIARKPYWLYQATVFVIQMTVMLAMIFAGASEEAGNLAWAGVTLILLWPSLAISIKRWHDRNKSGFWIFINVLPIVGPMWAFIEQGFLPGTDGPNDYGDEPGAESLDVSEVFS